MKLIIQVPCFNEERALPITLARLPRNIPGVDRIEWLVVDDGSSDRTVEAARLAGVDHIIRLGEHRGLAAAFHAGVEAALERGADVIVNTDADNQYRADDIPRLIEPILAGTADYVIGARPLRAIPHFSRTKLFLQLFGSWVVRRLSGTSVPDCRSGFRALNRKTAARLDVFSKYTYTVETILQAGLEGFRVASVPISVNPDLRPSRLIRNVPSDVLRSTGSILRAYLRYNPLTAFFALGLVSGGALATIGSGMSALIGLGVPLAVGYLAHLNERNRRLLRDIRVPPPCNPVSADSLPRLRLVPAP